MTVLVDVLQVAIGIGGLGDGCLNLVVTHKHIGLPLVEGAVLVGVLGFDVVNGGEVAVTAVVVDGEGGRLVEGGRVAAAEGFGDHRRVCRKVQAQGHFGGLLGLAGGFLRYGQNHPVIHIGAAG